MTTVAVVGTLVDDRIRLPAGGEQRDLGGIAYAVAALAALGGGLRVLPVCRVTPDLEPVLLDAWRRWPNIDRSALVPTSGRATRVELDYGGAGVGGDRSERLRFPLAPLASRDLDAARGAEHVLINCITGFDIEPAGAEWLAARAGRVHLDLHSLMLSVGPDGRRRGDRPADLERWITLADTLQCNQTEATLAAAGRMRSAWLEQVHGARTGVVIVTAGERGAELSRSGRGLCRVEAPTVDAIDPTGAGDVLGGAFVASVARGHEAETALRIAVRAASLSCTVSGPAAVASLLAEGSGRSG